MKKKLMFILPFAVIFVAIVITVIIIFVSNNSDVVEQEEVVIKPEEVVPSNPDLIELQLLVLTQLLHMI